MDETRAIVQPTLKKVRCVTLTPGRYIYICPCGGRYQVMSISRTCRTVGVYCFYCKQQIGKHYRIMDEILEFSQNWNNKLNCDSFTTLRLNNPRKHCVGAIKNIYLKGIWKGTATIIEVRQLRLDQINNFISQLDTGLQVDPFRQMVRELYKKQPGVNWDTQLLDLCLLRYNKESKEPSLNL